jgi:hypothetical protein
MHAMILLVVVAVILLVLIIDSWASRVPRGVAFRPTRGVKGAPPPTTPPGDAWYIESQPGKSAVHSCSFIEFDERGDYLDFGQHQHAWVKIRELSAGDKPPALVVIYCHGWKNNSQSDDMVRFNSFLSRLANTPPVMDRRLRVHGIYVAWRGNGFLPSVDLKSDEYQQTIEEFGAPIVSAKYHLRWWGFPVWIPQQLSYWSRKGAAEKRVSGVPIARTIFTCANAATHFNPKSRVLVIGHSFGALMLERSLGQACVGALTAQWPWMRTAVADRPVANPLPFNCVLFVNSAAPSIHAKELSDLFWAHQRALEQSDPTTARKPIIISVTSSADSATGFWHYWANLLACLMPSLQRAYRRALFVTKPLGAPHLPVPQYYFYRRTPGHNLLLLDHWVVRATAADQKRPVPANDPASVLAHNMGFDPHRSGADCFYTTAKKGAPLAWKIDLKPEHEPRPTYEGMVPVTRGSYWIIGCDKRIIKSHGDVWSPAAMELYATLYLLT